MAPARSLHDIFAGLTGTAGAHEAATALRQGGHGDLPEPLLGEALVNYADTAPIEVAAQLAPFVTAHTGFAAEQAEPVDPAGALDLLTAALPAIATPAAEPAGQQWEDSLMSPPDPAGDAAPAPLELGFGRGDATGAGAGTGSPGTEPVAGPAAAPWSAGLELPDAGQVAEPGGHDGTGGLDELQLDDLAREPAADLDDLARDPAADLDDLGDADGEPGWA